VASGLPRIRVHDTLARALKPLHLSEDGAGNPLLKLYVCGITPYDSGHMGHAFTFAAFDVLVRFLEAHGVQVRYVQNVTDVDDPLFERARRDGVRWDDLARREIHNFQEDMAVLGWRRPDVVPKVSEEIPGILAAAERLEAAGYAYQTDAVYFEARRYPGFGGLSHRSRRSMLRKLRDEGLLGEVGPGAKRDHLDFPLWRRSAEDEPAWESPGFGPGRPGWHIECTAMAMRYLGEQIDVHGGGRDLVFSHHESERAQSESLTGVKPFTRAWMHTGMVRYQGAKMSKSLGNLVVVREAVQRAPAAAVRLYLVSHRYRRDWNFTWPGLERFADLAARLRPLLEGADRFAAPPTRGRGGELVREFRAALAEDLDTPRGLALLRRAAREEERAAAAWMLGVLAGTAALE